jgi:hypothetical protein
VTLALRMLDPRVDAGEVQAIWRGLEAVAQPPYFLTWGWMETWLRWLPARDVPPLAVLSDDRGAVAAGFLGHHRLLRHRWVASRALFLNTTGVPGQDELCLEHNALLCAPGRRVRVAELIARLPGDWDELVLPAIDRGAFPDLDRVEGFRVRVDRRVDAPFVDLAQVRAAPGGYLALLSASTRAQLRRARRAVGPIALEVAPDFRRARAIFDELVALHERAWRRRGQAGAFADPAFLHFHERLIETRFQHGELQLLRVHAGATTIGCLYNFVSSGRVLFYQSGLASYDDPHVKPGYLCQAAAIEHAADAGHAIYDLLGGDARYKHSLATGATELAWVRVQRPLLRFTIEEWLRRGKRAAIAWQRDRAARAVPVA